MTTFEDLVAAIQEQIETLLRGVEAWNGWRVGQPPETVIDLSGVDLRAEAIAGKPIAGPKGKADLRGADLSGAALRGVRLAGANLSDAHLENASLFRAELEGANLRYASLEGAFLSEARLKGADLFGAHLEGCNLFQAHLEGANLSNAHLEGAYLPEAHCERADLFAAHLEGAILDDAHLEGARLQGAHLEKADLRGAHLEGANFHQAHLKDANLSDAHLEGATLRGAYLGRERHRLAAPLWWVSIVALLLSLVLFGEEVRNAIALCVPLVLTALLLLFPRTLTTVQSGSATVLLVIVGLLLVSDTVVQLVMFTRGETPLLPWVAFAQAHARHGLLVAFGDAAWTSMTLLWLLFMPAHLFVTNETGMGLFILPAGKRRGPAWRFYLANVLAGAGLVSLLMAL